jgi:hypothetical protein
VVRGLLIHKDTIVYGPALTRAYHLGDEHGQPPRIVLDDELADWSIPTPVTDTRGNLLGSFRSSWRLDEDGRLFFDFLRNQFDNPLEKTTMNAQHLETLATARALATANLNSPHADETVLRKYQWLGSYFNAIRDEYGITTIEAIATERSR